MKKLISALVLSATFCSFAFAAATLKQNMKQIGTLVKQITATAQDPHNNQANATACEQVIQLFKLTLNQVPDSVATMPADKKAAAIQDYQNRINQEIELVVQLETAFNANDNAAAVQVLLKMKELKSDSHDIFDP